MKYFKTHPFQVFSGWARSGPQSKYICQQGLLAGMLCLSACLTPSPLAPTDTVSLAGQLRNEDGSAFAEAPVSLQIPFGSDQSTRSNGAGIYRFELRGSDTQLSGVAKDLEVLAESPGGAQVRQSVKALKTSIQLPDMRFWDGLQTPAAQAVVKGQRSLFSWQAPAQAVQDYRFRLRDQSGDLIWQSTNVLPSLELPLAVMAAGKNYSWQVSANFSDYQAVSRPRPITAEPELFAQPIQEIYLSDTHRALPSLHDGQARVQLSDRLELPQTGGLNLVIQLRQKSRIQALHWIGGGFETRLEVRTLPEAAPLVSHNVRDFAWLEWPVVTSDTLYLHLSATQGGFSDLAEIRILGPDNPGL